MSGELTIPILPCASINPMLEFYVAMGFEVTYQQARPNTYLCVKYGDIDLHFFTLKDYEPKNSYSTCLVLVPDLAGLHRAFSDGLRRHYGRVPVAGIPRISKLNTSNSARQLRFNVIDPGGNWVRFAEHSRTPDEGEAVPDVMPEAEAAEGQTKLSRAVRAADWLVEAHGDFEAAAQALDKALLDTTQADDAPVPPVHRVQALVLRASLAVSLNDRALAETLLSDARQIPLEAQEREALAAELLRADDLWKMLSG